MPIIFKPSKASDINSKRRIAYFRTMFQNKNIGTAQVSLMVSGIALVLFLLAGLFLPVRFIYTLMAALASCIILYGVTWYMVEHLVYRKIKLIYKLISQTKASKREEFYNQELLPAKTLSDVGDEVVRWAREHSVEMERLQHNETFRREFLMNLSHELKTPIFSAQGYIETLLDHEVIQDEMQRGFLEKAARSLDRLSDLVKDLDEISKLEVNAIPLIKTNFSIQGLIREVYEEFSQKAAGKGIRLSIKKGCEQDVEVHADRSKIRQVLVNLVENSINYGKQNGETSAGIYVVDARDVFIEITDNGIGIPEDQIPRVFERFFRTDTARSRNKGGSGLGLAIVKHIIEAHQHTVTCRSTPDVGTSFGFILDKA